MMSRSYHWRWVAPWIVAVTITATVPAADQADRRKPWPVSTARDGFAPADVDAVMRAYAPHKIATAGNQALYSLLNMAVFFPHQTVPRTGEPFALPETPTPAVAARTADTQWGPLTLEALIAHPESRIQGMLVLHRGEVVFERYPGMRSTDSHLWWSIAKIFAGVLTEMLIEEGRIDPQRSVTHYLPEFSDSGWADVPVDAVLNMRSGIDALDSAEQYADPTSAIGRLIHAEGILTHGGIEAPRHDDALKAMTATRAPGEKYEYSSANTNLLALLIERVTGQRFADVVAERIWSRIGAQGDGLMGLTPDGRAIAHGMFSSRLRDLGRFGLLFTDADLRLKLPRRLRDRIENPEPDAAYQRAKTTADAAEARVGSRPIGAFAQWDAQFADGDLFKSGFDGQLLYVSPRRDVVIAVFATSKGRSVAAYLRPIAALFPVTPAPD